MKVWDETWKTEEGRKKWLEPESYVVSFLTQFKKDGITKVLDLGFGVGRHAILLARESYNVYGLDTSPAGAMHAKQWSQQENVSIRLTLGEMDQLPFDSNSFDLILAWNVIYHGMSDIIRKTVREIERCLRPNGYLLCTLISTQHHKYGLGTEIERNTFILKSDKEKSVPHHYFDKEEIMKYFSRFECLKCDDVNQVIPGTNHWRILVKLMSE